MKRLIYVTLLMAILVLSYHFGASRAETQSSAIKVIGSNVVVVGESAYYLEISNQPYGWRLMPYSSRDLPPVPASSLASYFDIVAITTSGEGWLRQASGWVSLGIVPGGPQAIPQSSWGALKVQYRH